jgi:hypothetical protein
VIILKNIHGTRGLVEIRSIARDLNSASSLGHFINESIIACQWAVFKSCDGLESYDLASLSAGLFLLDSQPTHYS